MFLYITIFFAVNCDKIWVHAQIILLFVNKSILYYPVLTVNRWVILTWFLWKKWYFLRYIENNILLHLISFCLLAWASDAMSLVIPWNVFVLSKKLFTLIFLIYFSQKIFVLISRNLAASARHLALIPGWAYLRAGEGATAAELAYIRFLLEKYSFDTFSFTSVSFVSKLK